jgi:hypothetical protein
MTPRITARLLKFLLVLSTTLASLAWAQADFPNKPLKLIVPFPPGGVTDIVARTVSVKLSTGWLHPDHGQHQHFGDQPRHLCQAGLRPRDQL